MPYYLDPETDTTVAPYRRTVGHELEYASNPRVAVLLRERGHGTPGINGDARLHNAHCRCLDIDNYAIHTTSDCTAPGGEYLIGGSRGVLFGSPSYGFATAAMASAAQDADCGVTSNVGMHTHVGTNDLTQGQKINVLRAYLRYEEEIRYLAAGPLSEARNNGCTESHLNTRYMGISVEPTSRFWTEDENRLNVELPRRPTLNFNTNTVEFRVWNSTVAQWRMVLAGAVSSAIVQAAFENRRATWENPATLVEFLKGLLTPDMILLIQRQRNKFNAA